MDKRVYELAKELGISSKKLIEILWFNNIDVKNHLSRITEKQLDIVVKQLNGKSKLINNNTSSLKMIEIRGLFNYYNYRINLEENVNIFVAENGFGKTTILNIIVALLKNDKNKLKKLPFESIKIGINNKIIEIHKKELNDGMNIDELFHLCKRYLPFSDYNYLKMKYDTEKNIDIEEIVIILKEYMPNRIFFDRVLSKTNNNNDILVNLNKKMNSIQNLLKEEIVYFPTYRRIEEELSAFKALTPVERRKFQYELKKNMFNFGMEDVENIILSLTDKLKKDAVEKYSKMTGEVLDDLLSDTVDLKLNSDYIIDKEKVNIIIGRIGKNNIKHIDKLNLFIEGANEFKNQKFISYFLYKLILIYESQKEIDEKIKKFVRVCDKYLVNKKIKYDETLAEVKIENEENNGVIEFNQLSSGEKQIISLFAKLYLDTSDELIFIIDEPELSLSIIWQETLLEDIYDSGKISLLLVTTHSPFIFKNKFTTAAKELRSFKII